ncbi:hypothetical protein KKC13_08795 [bacterium]|nr:hypothetical protein [bacterium]MBU1958631.1 hypothetical protein [bacterium]
MEFDVEDIFSIAYDFMKKTMIIEFKSKKKDMKIKTNYDNFLEFQSEWNKEVVKKYKLILL